MHREEALGSLIGLHRCIARSRTRALVRVLGPVVQPPTTMMRNSRHELLLCRFVAGELIGHDGTLQIPMIHDQPAEEALPSFGIPVRLPQTLVHFPPLTHPPRHT